MEGLSHGNVGNESLGKDPLPEVSDPRWQLAGKVSNLYIYPVKSFMGNSLTTAKVGMFSLFMYVSSMNSSVLHFRKAWFI